MMQTMVNCESAMCFYHYMLSIVLGAMPFFFATIYATKTYMKFIIILFAKKEFESCDFSYFKRDFRWIALLFSCNILHNDQTEESRNHSFSSAM